LLLTLWHLFKLPLHIQMKHTLKYIAILQNIFLTMYSNIKLFPFHPSVKCTLKTYLLIDLLGLDLRSTYSKINTIAWKPFLTSAVKVLTWLFATNTKICTYAWSKQDQSLYSSSLLKIIFLCITQAYMKTNKLFFCFQLFICLYTFSAINFQGYCICLVSCYTLLSRFQLPWPLSGCHNTTTLFVVSSNECTKIWHIENNVRFIPHHIFCLPKNVHK